MSTTTEMPKKERSEEEVNTLLDLLETNTMQGRTAKLLDYCSSATYAVHLREMFCSFITSDEFQAKDSDAQNDFAFDFLNLFEYVSKLDQN